MAKNAYARDLAKKQGCLFRNILRPLYLSARKDAMTGKHVIILSWDSGIVAWTPAWPASYHVWRDQG